MICTVFMRLTPYPDRTVIWSRHGDARPQSARHPRCAARRRQCGARGGAVAAKPVGDEPGAGAIACDDGRSAAGQGRARARSDAAGARAPRAGRSARAGRRGGAAPRREARPQDLVRTFTLRTSEGFVENFGPGLIARVGAEAPGVRLRFVQKPDKDSAPLRDGDRRSGNRRRRGRRPVRRCGRRRLFRDRFIGVVRKRHSLSKGKITPHALCGRQAHPRFAARSRQGTDRRSAEAARARTGDRHDRRRLCDRAGSGARLRSDRQRSRTAHREPARRNAQFPAAGRHAGVHGVAALAPAAGCRSGAPLAARMCAGRLRRLGPICLPSNGSSHSVRPRERTVQVFV